MALIPQLVRRQDELDSLTSVLKEFYLARPDNYGLMDRPETDYGKYAEVIRRYTPENGKVLDLGCGTYRSPSVIHALGFQTTGCDLFSPDKLREYRNAVSGSDIRLISYDGRSLPFEDSSFDTAASLCMFEHLSDADRILTEMLRILKPGGRLIIMAPNMSGPHRGVLGLIRLAGGASRFWQFRNPWQCLVFILRALGWTITGFFRKPGTFYYMVPLMENGRFVFEQPDDDAIQMNCPVLFRNWFRAAGCGVLEFNSRCGDSHCARLFNRCLPWFATFVQIVAEKKQTFGICPDPEPE
ncbi:class I SAM-dependent methyltransferase [bacterium]|nr:class I SAM-dependent methyltransferase [bacterium]